MFIAVFYALMSYANIVSISHMPASGTGHDNASIVALHAGGHDHSDAESEPAGKRLGHHGADHSHDTPNLLSSPIPSVVKFKNVWLAAYLVQAYPSPCFSFERPPRYT